MGTEMGVCVGGDGGSGAGVGGRGGRGGGGEVMEGGGPHEVKLVQRKPKAHACRMNHPSLSGSTRPATCHYRPATVVMSIFAGPR